MTYKLKLSICLFALVMDSAVVRAGGDPLQHLETYRQGGIEQFDEQNGRRLWNSTVNERGCTNCHGDNPGNTGKHVKTGKAIRPMALSVNAERYQDAKKIEKWFLRNCKWTFGRKCSAQEKADILTWLSNQ